MHFHAQLNMGINVNENLYVRNRLWCVPYALIFAVEVFELFLWKRFRAISERNIINFVTSPYPVITRLNSSSLFHCLTQGLKCIKIIRKQCWCIIWIIYLVISELDISKQMQLVMYRTNSYMYTCGIFVHSMANSVFWQYFCKRRPLMSSLCL